MVLVIVVAVVAGYLSVCLSVCLSARLKTKLFCEASSVFELDNIKNAAILRDFFNFWTWQRQKRNNSARLPHFSKLTTSKTKQFCCQTSFKNGKLSAELTASYQFVLRFFHSTCLKYCACHEKVRPGHTKCCTCHDMWHVSCTAPATEKSIFADPLQMSHACHRFWKCYKTLTFCSLLTRYDKVHNPLRLPHETTSERPKVVRTCSALTCWPRNVRRATSACTFSTSQLPNVLRHWSVYGVLYILTSKRALRHNCVQLFISHLTARRFSEPTFRPSGATNHRKKTQWIATFLPFRAPAASFLFDFFFLIFFFSYPLWLFPSPLFHLSILSEVWLLNFLRSYK